MLNIQNFGKSILAGRLPDYVKTLNRHTHTEYLRGEQFKEYQIQERAFFKIGNTKYSCLNTPEAIKAIAGRLAKAKNITTEKPKTDKLPGKQSPFAWSVACSFLTSDSGESPAECLQNYTEYLALYDLTVSKAQARKPSDVLVLVKIKPYLHQIAGLPDFIESVVYSACDGRPFVKDAAGLQVTHHATGMLVTYEKDFKEKMNKLSPDHITRAAGHLEKQTVLNPSVDNTTPGKFTHLYYSPDDLKNRIAGK